jgi:hypothetical protein
MFIIGERINGMFRSVARAIADRDEAAIGDLARRQVEAGAHALDVNTGPTEGDPVEVMRWLSDHQAVVTCRCDRQPRSRSSRLVPPAARDHRSTTGAQAARQDAAGGRINAGLIG